MKKVEIFTWYNYGVNYGQTLQAFALQSKIRELGYEAENVTYGMDALLPQKDLNNFLKLLIVKKDKRRIQKKFNDFVNKNMNVSKPLVTLKAVLNYLKKRNISILVCGSDQIWNPHYIKPAYFLALEGDFKRIAYAVSICEKKYVSKFAEHPNVRKWIKDFDYLSVRENTGVDIVKQISGCDAELVLDPTLLFNGEEWCRMLQISKKNSNYVFCYMFDITDEQYRYINRMAEQYGCDEIRTNDSGSKTIEQGYTIMAEMGVEEFVENIANARVIITDSFHGTAFSVLMNKEVYVIDNGMKEGSDPYYNIDRMNTLLVQLGLEDRLVILDQEKGMMEPIDYSSVEEKIQELRKKSISFLKESLEN